MANPRYRKRPTQKIYKIGSSKFSTIAKLAEQYGVSYETARNWIKQKRTSGGVKVLTQTIIIED
jgi:transposase-like protein